jgi:protocatechuate 3,4-dioxygenase beta subunit
VYNLGPRAFSGPHGTVASMRSTTVRLAVLPVCVFVLFGCSKSTSDSASLASRSDLGSCTPTDPGESYSNTDVDFPLRADLPDLAGTSRRIEVSGRVLNADCSPVENTLVKFWASRENGNYTQDSYGSTLTDQNGFYKFTLPAPVAYPSRRAHVHMESSVGAQPVFTEIFVEDGIDSYTVELVPSLSAPKPTNLGSEDPTP